MVSVQRNIFVFAVALVFLVLPFVFNYPLSDVILLVFPISFVFVAIQQRLIHKRFEEATLKEEWDKSPVKVLYPMLFWALISGLTYAVLLNIIAITFKTFHSAYSFFAEVFLIGVVQAAIHQLLSQGLRLQFEARAFIKESKGLEYMGKVSKKQSLQDLVSPHFLFNSLNTAASIIVDDGQAGKRYLNELKDLYDFIIRNNENTLILLEEELDIVQKYIYLLQTRFGENFEVDLLIPDEILSSPIPPMTLQNLLENAVKHNVISRKQKLHVVVEVVKDKIVVRNNLNPKKVLKEESTNLGLDYIKTQYKVAADKLVVFGEQNNEFVVELPILH